MSKGYWCAKFDSLEMIQTVLMALYTRRMEKVELYNKTKEMVANGSAPYYPLTEARMLNEIDTLEKAYEAIREADLVFPDRQEVQVEEEEVVPIRIL